MDELDLRTAALGPIWDTLFSHFNAFVEYAADIAIKMTQKQFNKDDGLKTVTSLQRSEVDSVKQLRKWEINHSEKTKRVEKAAK
jgi:hypothetical protein